MLRKEEKSEPQKTIHQLLDESVTYIAVHSTACEVVLYFHPEKLADKVREALKIGGKGWFIILNKQQLQTLWGKQGASILYEAGDVFEEGRLFDKGKGVKLTKFLVSASISNSSLYQLLVRQWDGGMAGRYVFHDVLSCLQNQPVEVCIQLIDAMSDATLNRVMRFEANNDRSTLFLAFESQPPEVCIRLIDRMTDESLILALKKAGRTNDFPIYVAFSRQSPEVCLWLLDRMANIEALKSQFKLEKNENEMSLFRLALFNQSSKVCIRLIELFDQARLRHALWSSIVNAVHCQSGDVFVAIVKKLSSDVLAEVVCVYTHDKMIEMAARYQSSVSFKYFLLKLSNPDAKERINKSLREPKVIDSCFKAIALYQPIESFEMFLSILDDKNKEEWLKMCKEQFQSSETRFALRALQWKLKKRGDVLEDPVLTELLSPLRQLDEQKPADENKPAPMSEEEEKAIRLFSSGAFVKIIREDNVVGHIHFVTHLFNPARRDIIRNRDGKPKQGFKLVLNPSFAKEKKEAKNEKASAVVYSCPDGFAKVIKARTEKERVQHKAQKQKITSTTKHPATYVSIYLNTALFGYHANREMVGYAFIPNEKNIKLLSTQDCGTYTRWWYNTDMNKLISAAEYAKKIICNNFADFVKRVDNQPYVVNEVLVKLRPLDLFAIVIGKDTGVARRIAISRRLELIRLHKVDLPILIYNPEKRKVIAYASIDQHHEHPRIFLAEIKAVIEQEILAAKRLKSFFNKSSALMMIKIHIDAGVFTISQPLAKNIISIINSLTEKSYQAFTDIMAILEPQKEHALRQLSLL